MDVQKKLQEEKTKAFSNINTKSFILVVAILTAILIVCGTLSYIIPQGAFLRDEITGEASDKKLYAMISATKDERPFMGYQGSPVSLLDIANGAVPQDMLRNINGYKYHDFVREYARYCNSDGVYPVTEELKVLLQGFCTTHRYFADGEGTFEGMTGVYADEDEQWLFACGFYK